MMNESTKKIRRNFQALSPDEQEKALALLLELAESADTMERRDHLIAVHDTLKNAAELEKDGGLRP